MSKIIEFPVKNNKKFELRVVDQEKIEECASAILIYLNGLHVSDFANWEEITNGLIIAFVNTAHKSGLEPEETMAMLRSVNIQDIEDFNG